MRVTDLVRRSGKNLRSSKIRTVLTSLAIAVGGFTLVLTLGAGNGLRSYTTKLVETNFDPTELIVGRDKEISNTGAPKAEPKEYDDTVSSLDLGSGKLQVKRVSKIDIDEIKAQSYVESVRESFSIDTKYITRDGQKKYTLSSERYNPAQKPELRAGSLPDPNNDLASKYITLPEAYIPVLGFASAEDSIDKEVQINVAKGSLPQDLASTSGPGVLVSQNQKTITYRIKAVTKKPATSFATGQLPVLLSGEDARELYDFTTQNTTDYEKYVYVNVRVKDGSNEEVLQNAKQNLESKGYIVQSSKDIQKSITQFVNILQGMVFVFGFITLVASVFGIVNTQYISVLERTREIGLMKALGMRNRDVKLLFMLEASWIGFLGGLIGAVIAIVLGILINPWVSEKLDLGEGSSLIIFNPFQIIGLIFILVFIATIAGFLPARKAARMDPIEALRTD